jgi:hypothetical protein
VADTTALTVNVSQLRANRVLSISAPSKNMVGFEHVWFSEVYLVQQA